MSNRPPGGISVLVVADPGVPTRRIRAIEDEFEEILQHLYSPPVHVFSRTEMVRIAPERTLDLADARRIAEDYDRIDVTLLLTEIPRHTSGKPLVAEIFSDESVGVLSCPTFGAWSTKKRILTTMVDCVARLSPPPEPSEASKYRLRWSEWTDEPNSGTTALHANTFTGGPRMVLGMTMANDPWRTAPRLSSALAAASATGAFGIFYNSIWEMSETLSSTRLLFIGILAMSAMGLWLIVGNRLWDRPRQERYASVILFYNMSTVLTVALCMLLLYLSLAVLILIGALVVIDPEFMTAILGKDATFRHYLDIAWLSAAMGTVAGALGSSFDSETDLKKLTHGQRERQRMYSESYSRGADEDDPTSYVERATRDRRG